MSDNLATLSGVRPWRTVQRRPTRQISVGSLKIGGDAPISIQSMTNTLTTDVAGTLAQVEALAAAGADCVRISCPDQESTAALKTIVAQSSVPIVADIHYHYKRAIEAAQSGAHCLRINPGNIGSTERVREVVRAAKDFGCSIRVGVNGGSLEKDLLDKYREPTPEALVESAMRSIAAVQEHDFNEIKVSVKASDVFMAIRAYELLSQSTSFPLHLGITEAGPLRLGTIKSAAGLGHLLIQGIGDTIRISLSANPVEEIYAGFDLLKSLGLRHRGVNIISCPSCARQQFDVIDMVAALEEKVAHITTPLTVSILGCVVNGIGEAEHSDLGVIGGGKNRHLIYQAGKPSHKMTTENLIEDIYTLILKKVEAIEAESHTVEPSKPNQQQEEDLSL